MKRSKPDIAPCGICGREAFVYSDGETFSICCEIHQVAPDNNSTYGVIDRTLQVADCIFTWNDKQKSLKPKQ